MRYALTSFLKKAFGLNELKDSRLHWVDYLKGIAIILVVYRHVLIGIERSGLIIPVSMTNANMIFYSFRMPLFFVLSGIFITGSLAKRTASRLIAIKFETLLYPYLVWSFLQVTSQILLSNFTNSSRTLIDYTYIFYQPQNLDQFWYLPALFNTTLIYVLLKVKLKVPPVLQVCLGMAFYTLSPYLESISMLSDWMKFYIFFAIGDAISSLFFSPKVQAYLKNPLLLLGALPFFLLIQLYYLQHPDNRLTFLPIALAGCGCMFLVAFQLQKTTVFSFLRVLGYHSLQIYVMHVMVIGLVRVVMMDYLQVHRPAALLLAGIVFGVLVPILLYNLFIRNNIGWFLFSFHRKPKTGSAKVQTKKRATLLMAS